MDSIIKINDKFSFDLDKVIGPEIFEGLWENHKKVAVKRSSKSFNEAKILLKLCNLHSGVVAYFGTFNDQSHHYLVLEHFQCTLKDFIMKDDEEITIKNVLIQICEGLNFLHCRNIVLGSLKSDNVILTSDLKAKLFHFEAAREISFASFNATVWGSDIKMLGDIFVFTLTKNKTFKYLQDYKTRSDKVVDCVLAISLISTMLSDTPENRPPTNEIIEHPYFWSPKKKLEFIFDIRKRLDLQDELTQNLSDDFNQCASVIEDDWTQNLSSEVMQEISKTFKKHDKAKISDLLRFIRNKWAHSGEWNHQLKLTFGSTDSSFYEYFDGHFPKLFKHIYDIIKENFKDNDSFVKYFVGPSISVGLHTESLILDLSKDYPKESDSLKNLQELTLENCNMVSDKLIDFINKNGLVIHSLTLLNSELRMDEFINILNGLPKLKLIKLNGVSILLKEKSSDETKPLPDLQELSDLKLKDINDSKAFSILMNSINLRRLEIENLSNGERCIKRFVLQQNDLKILRTKGTQVFGMLFEDNINAKFQLSCLNLISTESYDSHECGNFLQFIATQHKLEDICVTIEMDSPQEYQKYFDHILGLESLQTVNIDYSNVCLEYFKTCTVINETVSSIMLRLHNGFQYYLTFMNQLPSIFPNLVKLNFEVNSKLKKVSEQRKSEFRYNRISEIARKQSLCSIKNEVSSVISFLKPLNSMMSLREIKLEVECSSELSAINMEMLESFHLTIKKYSDERRNNFHYINSMQFVDNEHFNIFFKNNSNLKTLQVDFAVILDHHIGGIVMELMELIVELNFLEKLTLSSESEKYFSFDTAALVEMCKESQTLQFVKIFGTEKKF